MATSPSPNSSPSADPPVSTTAPPPETLSPPPAPLTSTLSPPPAPLTSTLSPPPVPLTPSSQQNASSPTATPTTPSHTPPSTNLTASPPVPLSPLPTQPPISSPPPPPAPSSNPPESSPPQPSPNPPSSSPTPPTPSPPSTSPPPPSDLPARSPPPLSPNPPTSPPTPPSPKTPASPPATASEPSRNTPPTSPSPESPPATPSPPSQPTEKSPPPPSTSLRPPEISPPPEESKPPQSPPLPPGREPPEISPPPSPTSIITPPPASPDSPPSSTITHKLSPPSPGKRLSPPPPSLVPPSPPSLSQGPIPPSVNLTTNTSRTPSTSNSTDNASIGTGGTVAICLVLGLILLSLIGAAVWCVRKRKRKFVGLKGDHVTLTSLSSSLKSDSALLKMQTSGAHNGSGTGNDFVNSPTEHGGVGNSRSWFTYQELVNATNGFSMQNLLGEGGFGSVYKGYLFGGREVAIKQLKIGGGQGEREFKAEVEIISRVHHRHLVSLVGYCISESQRLLVYDYVPNNNLYFHLHGESRPVMEWATRVKAAAGAARGIAYLHEDCHPRIIHRDIKSSNILLDNSFEARVSDFGLAKLALEANTHITTRVMGTFGYMAPEYASSGKLTEKSDVYSFGVVLLELITGRKPVDTSQPLGDESLVEWARPLLNHALDNEDFKALADPRLENNYVDSEMFRIIEAAAACVRHSAAKRPRMRQVVRAFDSLTASDLTNGMRVGESELFNSAQQSAEIRLFQRMAFSSQDYSTNSFRQNSWNS